MIRHRTHYDVIVMDTETEADTEIEPHTRAQCERCFNHDPRNPYFTLSINYKDYLGMTFNLFPIFNTRNCVRTFI